MTEYALDASPLHLMHRVSQTASDRFSEVVPISDLTPRQFAVLAAVQADEGLSQTGLVATTGIDRSTLADIVRRMINKGLLSRERTKTDARTYAIKLTNDGRKTLETAIPAVSRADHEILAVLNEHERAEFSRLLLKLIPRTTDDHGAAATNAA